LESESLDSKAYFHYNVLNYDDIARSLLTVFHIITSETWFPFLLNLMDGEFPALAVVYIITIIIVG